MPDRRIPVLIPYGKIKPSEGLIARFTNRSECLIQPYILRVMKKNRINNTKKKGKIKPLCLYILRRGGKQPGL